MNDCEPLPDLRAPKLAVLIHELKVERSKPEVDQLAVEQLLAQIYRLKEVHLEQATAASKRPMHPLLVAALRPTSRHLRVA